MHLLIAYRYLPTHNDPFFEEFTYGDINARGNRLRRDIQKGDYVFFHTGMGSKKFITAYYVIEQVLDTEKVVQNKEMIAKYKNPHIGRFLKGVLHNNDVMIFGDSSKSKILDQDDWVVFDKALAEKLSLNVTFHDNRTENQDIVSATRQYRTLTDKDVQIILNEVSRRSHKNLVKSHINLPQGGSTKLKLSDKIHECPEWLVNLTKNIEILRADSGHQERAHESLVESFYELLGFAKFIDIKHQQGRIDIGVKHQDETIIINEVKKTWNLSYRDKTTMLQAYRYSLESGARFVVITNGDYYAVFDRDKGRSYESNFVGDFQLSKLEKEDLKLIDCLKKENITPRL